jgi:hypothetical protein
MPFRAPKRAEQARNKLRNAGELGRGIATWSAPTIEGRRKSADWSVEDRPGGLKVHRDLSLYDRAVVDGHFSREEQDAALHLLRDLEFSGHMGVVISRVYDGMPNNLPVAGGYALRSQAQWEVAARLEWVLGSMTAGWHYLLWVLVLGVCGERVGKPLSLVSLEGLTARLCRYHGKDQCRAFLVGLTKGALMRLAEAYAKWPQEKQRREEARKLRQAQLADKPKLVDLGIGERDADTAREILMKEYYRVVLGKRA